MLRSFLAEAARRNIPAIGGPPESDALHTLGLSLPVRPPLLRADCNRCSGLCCVSLAFDRSRHFAIDKAAGVPCPHLTHADRCRIHQRLGECGFAGCARYDCLGAGQRVTEEVLPGRHWRDGREQARRLFEAFRVLRRVHEALELLAAASRLPLTQHQRTECHRLAQLLAPEPPWTERTLADVEDGPVFVELRSFLASLRGSVERRGRRHLPTL